MIGSLNGVTPGGWTHYANLIAEAGADALELNLYSVPTESERTGLRVEDEFVELVFSIKATIGIPLTVKLSPFFTSPVAFVKRLEEAGADGVVMFNRFYQPDFDLEALEVKPSLQLSTPQELLLRLHWVALMYPQVHSRFGRHRRRSLSPGRAQGHDGRRPRGDDDVGPSKIRHRASAPSSGKRWWSGCASTNTIRFARCREA